MTEPAEDTLSAETQLVLRHLRGLREGLLHALRTGDPATAKGLRFAIQIINGYMGDLILNLVISDDDADTAEVIR